MLRALGVLPWVMFLFLACPLPQLELAGSRGATTQIVSLQKFLRIKMLIAAKDIRALQPFAKSAITSDH